MLLPHRKLSSSASAIVARERFIKLVIASAAKIPWGVDSDQI
jgi:hypothetical protein